MNLNINRIIFSKTNNDKKSKENISLITEKVGKVYVSAFKQKDLDYINLCMKTKKNVNYNEIESIEKAGLFPPYQILKEFMSLILKYEDKKQISFYDILQKYLKIIKVRFDSLSKLKDDFIFLKNEIREIINIPIENEECLWLIYNFYTCPIKNSEKLKNYMTNFFFQFLYKNLILGNLRL